MFDIKYKDSKIMTTTKVRNEPKDDLDSKENDIIKKII